jgi:hypothetical protein
MVQAVLLNSQNRVVVHPAPYASTVSPLVVTGSGVSVGGGSPADAVQASNASLRGTSGIKTVARLISDAAASPGVDAGLAIEARHVKDGSVSLERLGVLPVSKGGTGLTSVSSNALLFGRAAAGAPGEFVADPRVRWDDAKKELAVEGRLSIGGVDLALF